ncbi:hypothetical protein B0A54_04202 [Friedmanniomyces endolithicus]|uniref:Uncharacterized protein n=1 Tax=Friedmanniomyces endolithicus TaxID=329885 RepID=A0A4U0VAG4_9PEZI|nr:hypothetical protein B0A54_04202 [Friedmanniomyces endolithicus]
MERENASVGRRGRSSGGFLLDSGVTNGSPRASDLPHRSGKRKAQNGYLHVDKRRNLASRFSVDGSVPGSPLSREVSLDAEVMDPQQRQATSRAPSMDPAQLVQMALDLSESRRRGVSGGLQLPSPARIGRRSSGLRPADTMRQASRQRQRASYAANEPTRQSSARYSVEPGQDGTQDEETSQDSIEHGVPRTFTPATLSRAQRARKYFELASEHRRLLQYLPPLKPDADAHGNHTLVATNTSGSANRQTSRADHSVDDQHSLGRPYNPLQALRNRRLRNRERQTLPAPPDTWQDIEVVRRWIDDVETATEQDEHRHTLDRVELPKYEGDNGVSAVTPESGKGHRKTDTASTVITRPENGWSIEPAELLADTYWIEKGHHKGILEGRGGSPILARTARRSMDRPRQSRDTARSSNEYQKTADEDDKVSFLKRAHRGPLLSIRRPKILPRSGSTSSASTDGGRSVPQLGHGMEEYENIGPLEKHMQHLIAKYEEGELTSPVLLSPDHWDSQSTQLPVAHNIKERSRRDTSLQENGRVSSDTARQHRRAKSADGRAGSADGVISRVATNETLSPAVSGFRSSLDVDRSSRQHQSTFARQKAKLHNLPLFRGHSKERNGVDRTDFANAGNTPLSSAEYGPELLPRMSRESARPASVHRHRTNDSIASVQRQGTGTSTDSAKEASSTVGRLLKGGRIGELVRNEGARLGDRIRGRDKLEDNGLETASESSDSGDDDEPSPRTSVDQSRTKPKYFLPNLPTFRSPMARAGATTSGSLDSDPIARQQRAQKEAGRSTRFDLLAPPRIQLPLDEDELGTNMSNRYIDTDRKKSYGFLGAAASNGSSVSFAESSHTGRVPRPKSQRQRHWSISDKPHSVQLDKVSARDVARVKALLLSSGVKAREIQRRANSHRDRPLPLYAKISENIGEDFRNVPRKEEHLVASHLLAEHLSTILSDFEQSLDRFQNSTVKQLSSQLDDLGRKAADQLTTTVHDTSDDADAFIAELTTKVPQDVKRVDDAIDEILRERRRQFRLLRRAGFKLLEWLVLGIMWWVWFVVVLFNMGRRVVVGVLVFLKWLLWF